MKRKITWTNVRTIDWTNVRQNSTRDRYRYRERVRRKIDIHTDKEKEDKYVDKSDLKTFKNLYEQNIGLINGITAEYLIELSETIDVNLLKGYRNNN